MALTKLVVSALSVFLLFALVNGQPPICDQRSNDAGQFNKPHETYGERYYACNSALIPTLLPCGEGLLFNTDTGNCDWPWQTKNTNWPCDASRTGQLYPRLCCSTHYQCIGTGFVVSSCPAGQTFNKDTRTCGFNNQCVDVGQCSPPLTQSPGPVANCSLVADTQGNPCMYRWVENGVTSEARPCADGAEFSPANCTCIHSTRCSSPSNATLNKIPDITCGASWRLDFLTRRPNSNIPQTYSDKMSPGGFALNQYVEMQRFTYTDGTATRSNVQSVSPGYVYSPYFSGRDWAPNTVITATFRADQTGQGTTAQILGNTYEGLCAPTVSVNATINNGVYSFTVSVTGATLVSVNNKVTVTYTGSGNLNASPADWIKVIVQYTDRRATVTITNRGSGDNNANGQTLTIGPSGDLGAALDYNICGLQFGRNLPGALRKCIIYEGCSEITRVRNV